ncbi:MAG: serine protease, partial [Leptolyngbyaceae cyanobacterium CAN_BIN12]|nr:serine protease [Leptolyngbyaceae cyanobacterium CAN_BIN12]
MSKVWDMHVVNLFEFLRRFAYPAIAFGMSVLLIFQTLPSASAASLEPAPLKPVRAVVLPKAEVSQGSFVAAAVKAVGDSVVRIDTERT